ncbi:hypothetical protein FRC19_005084 [Serendipita sp. 401]|nr:hypothetical protein FRC19_005084 [Serendipita sp. 401]
MKGESGGSSRVGSDDEDEENAENNEGNHERRVQEEEDENMRDVLDSVLPRDITTSPDPVGSPVPTFSVMMNKTTTSLGSVFNLIPALRDHRGWTNPILFSIPPAPSQCPPRIVPRRGSSRSSHTSSSISPAIASQSLSRYQNTATTTTTATATSRFQVNQADITRAVQLALYNRGFSSLSRQLEPEWTRRLEGQMRFLGPGPGTGVGPPYAYTPGSLQGTWEGGFLYLDFPEYAQFLTGEREADAAFYEAPPEKTYGSNRQVWKLKEYELFSDSYPQAEQDLSESIKSLNSTSTRSDIYAAITGGRAAAVMPIGNGTNRNQPLSIGRWKDGWLPPADRLEWRFPEDGSDEVEIVEKVDVVAAATNEETNAKTKLVLQVNKTPELGKKEEETRKEEANEGDWAKEKAGMAGKLRGRPRERLGPLDLASSDDANPDTSTTPVGRKIPLESPDGRLPQRRQQPEPSQSTDPNMRQTYGGSTSPPPPSFVLQTIQPSNSSPPKSALTTTFSRLGSPTPISPPPSSTGSKAKPFIGEGRTFRWGWKSKKKLEKEKAVERASIQPIEIPGLTDRSRRRASFDYDDRVGARDQELVEGVEGAGRQYRSSSAAPPDRKESYDSILEEPEGEEQQRSTAGAAAFEPMNRKEVIEEVQRENVSKYVRWDPDVDWARQAIWGPRPVQKTTETISTGVNSLSSSMTGKLRGHLSSSITAGITSGQSASRGPPTSIPTSMSTKVKPPSRYVRDILVFGESFSSWGEATLRGRIRLHDGLVTIVKTYPQRATWVYTGYVVGGENFVGRWRDADSPEEVNGYEGPFAMKRRR